MLSTMMLSFLMLTTLYFGANIQNVSASSLQKSEEIFTGGFSQQQITVEANKMFTVDLNICAIKDAPDTIIQLVVPDLLIQLVEGTQEWVGDVKKGETVSMSFSLVALGDLDFNLRADVKIGQKYSSSFFVDIRTAASIAGNIGLMQVSEGSIPLTSNPQSSRVTCISTAEPAVGADQLRFYGTVWYTNDQGVSSPCRLVEVRIMDDDTGSDELVTTAYTDENGHYDIITDNNDGFLQGGRDPYVQIWSIGLFDWETKNSGGDTYLWQSSVLKDGCAGGEEFNYGGFTSVNNEAMLAGDACYAEAGWVFDSVGWERGQPSRYSVASRRLATQSWK